MYTPEDLVVTRPPAPWWAAVGAVLLPALCGCPALVFDPEERGDGWPVPGQDDDDEGIPFGDVVATARIVGEHWGDAAGFAVAGAGDVDGDGFSDVLVGAPYHATGGGNSGEKDAAGAAYLLAGSLSGEVSLADATARWVGAETYEKAGWELASLGPSGPGEPVRLAIGSAAGWTDPWGMDRPGRVDLVPGTAEGQHSLADAGATLLGTEPDDLAGFSVAGIGDVDGDGAGDLAVGAPGHTGGGPYAGAVHIWVGDAVGDLDLSASRASWIGEAEYSMAGMDVAGVGDADGDGGPDVLIGAPSCSEAEMVGRAYLVSAGAEGSQSLAGAVARLEGEYVGDGAGTSVAGAGDVDGDGLDDLLIGAPYVDLGEVEMAGIAYLLLGPVAGDRSLADADARLTGGEFHDYAGAAIAGAGDVDGDGLDDLLVAALGADVVYLIRGPVEGSLPLQGSGWGMSSPYPSGRAIYAVAGVGDVDSDGLDDVLIGLGSDGTGGHDAGAAYLVVGAAWPR